MSQGFRNFCLKQTVSTRRSTRLRELMSQVTQEWNKIYFRLVGFSRLMRQRPLLIGFSTSVIGVFGGSNCGGLNFNMSPRYSPKESYQNNLKAMVVAMMMTDKLDNDEVAILTNAVDSVYQDEKKDMVTQKRKAWCFAEMKNFMNCSEQFGTFQDERCKGYRKLLKACLEAKKGCVEITGPNYDKSKANSSNTSSQNCQPPSVPLLTSCDIARGVTVRSNNDKNCQPPSVPLQSSCDIVQGVSGCSNNAQNCQAPSVPLLTSCDIAQGVNGCSTCEQEPCRCDCCETPCNPPVDACNDDDIDECGNNVEFVCSEEEMIALQFEEWYNQQKAPC